MHLCVYAEKAVDTKQHTEELEQKKKCKISLIINGTKESVGEQFDERKEDDLLFVASRLHELKC